jgi:hypothetical protein
LKSFYILATAAILFCPFDVKSQEARPTQLYWGDTHLHTGLSFDAYAFGAFSRPDLAYQYAKGREIEHPILGTPTRIEQPLDFLIIADHAEVLGTVSRVLDGDAPDIAQTKAGKFVVDTAGGRSQAELDAVYNYLNMVGSGIPNDSGLTALDLVQDLHGENIRPSWVENIETADAHNEPGKFTAMIGWEWTSQPGGANLHRVVFMPQGADIAGQFLPYSTLESDDPADLWAFLEAQEKATGAEFLAIPHGPNISMGMMFGLEDRQGAPIDTAYAEVKSKYETTIEVTQIKGDSEVHPMFAPDDQFADYEPFNFVSSPEGLTPDPTEGDYVRSGLRRGLALQARLGVNPYKQGMAAGSDSHIGIPQIEEYNFGGKSGHDAKREKRSKPSGIGSSIGWDMGAAGFTGVWAKDNTRRAIFEAFRRREVYATTGPRIWLRFFGGFGLTPDHAHSASFVDDGYANGVPMGGDLGGMAADKAPSFTIEALKDANSGNLDRIQIVKGWLNADGSTSEKVFDVALSDGRTDGSQLVGNTVDLATGEYTNDIGDVALRAYWQDPEFDPAQAAFYYARVLEIPTPRYSLLDAVALNIDVAETGRPATIQERAYSSPIWYTPQH